MFLVTRFVDVFGFCGFAWREYFLKIGLGDDGERLREYEGVGL